jgi:uncharacterized coiled-coil protein SlyX
MRTNQKLISVRFITVHMGDKEADSDVESTAETERETQEVDVGTEETAVDVEAIDTYQRRIEELSAELNQREQTIGELESVVEAQSERIDELESQFLDLSARVADGRNLGVCPECNGPTERKSRLFRNDTIECVRCGEVVHTY